MARICNLVSSLSTKSFTAFLRFEKPSFKVAGLTAVSATTENKLIIPLLINCRSSHSFFARGFKVAGLTAVSATTENKLIIPLLINCRSSHSFFARVSAEQLWKGATSVSNAGRKKGRGRGSGRKRIRDLNRGQVIGFGKVNMLWPGLNSPVIQGRQVLEQQELPPDESREKRLLELRDKMSSRRGYKIHPLERGWSGTKLGGRSLGPPDPVGEDKFEGFDSRVLEYKIVMHVTGQRGKIRNHSAFVVSGNKKGLAGFALSKSMAGMTAAKSARNKAGKQLRYIERFEDRTVLHDFFTEFGAVKIFVEQRPEGFGLCCHRVIKCICEMVGIKDLWAKVEGPFGNTQCVTKAFFIGLMRQKSLQQLADEKGLHVIQMEKNRDNFPVVMASPAKCRTEEEINPTELLDWKLHLHNGKAEAPRKKFQPFYINYPSYIQEMKHREYMRNMRDVKIHMLTHYGEITSFLHIREKEKEKQKLKETVEEAL